MLYFGHQNKRNIWNTVFNIEQFEDRRTQLGFGMKTEGYMASILFQRTTLIFIPQDKKELQLRKRRIIISNWTKGLYPLYKNPYRITEEDSIVGIDPGTYAFNEF
ncbi:unnamed protein product [Mucor hiemalis]